MYFVYFGLDYGIKNVGHFALRCLRIEKFIPFWGEEITGDTTPNEVNRAYKVKFDKQHFIGILNSFSLLYLLELGQKNTWTLSCTLFDFRKDWTLGPTK